MNRSCNDKHCVHYHKGLCAFKEPEKHCKKLKELDEQLSKAEQELKEESLFEVEND